MFFWTFVWCLFGTFIGVLITLAILTFCEQLAWCCAPVVATFLHPRLLDLIKSCFLTARQD
jgi:hypothetical protein